MECAKWVEEGLLYTSGELAKDAAGQFEQHLATCEFCSREIETYRYEKAELFTSQFLEEPTSAQVDVAVKAACAKIPRPAVSAGFFTVFARRGVVPVLFLLLGFAGGAYVTFTIERAGREGVRVAAQSKDMTPVAVPEQPSGELVHAGHDAHGTEADDSDSTDRTKSPTPAFNAGHRGNIDAKGVVPVDLHD